jgi:hypothetical protein
MHAATMRSKRLQRFVIFLSGRREATTRQIVRGAHVCAVNAIAAEARANGYKVTCTRRGMLFFYSLGARA